MQNSKAKRLRSKLAYMSFWVMEVESSLSRYHCWFVTVTVGLSWLLVFSFCGLRFSLVCCTCGMSYSCVRVHFFFIFSKQLCKITCLEDFMTT